MKVFYTCIVVIFLFSCKNKSVSPPKNEKATPKELQENEYDYSLSKRSQNDIVTSLYNGLADTTESLKKLEKEIDAIYEGKADSLEAIMNYKNQNSNFYTSAESHLNQVKDSVLRERILQHIKNSIAKYNGLKSSHEGLLDGINSKDQPISDLHTVLRVLSTVPIMERYQKDHLPTQLPLKNLNNDMNGVINKLDKEVKKNGG